MIFRGQLPCGCVRSVRRKGRAGPPQLRNASTCEDTLEISRIVLRGRRGASRPAARAQRMGTRRALVRRLRIDGRFNGFEPHAACRSIFVGVCRDRHRDARALAHGSGAGRPSSLCHLFRGRCIRRMAMRPWAIVVRSPCRMVDRRLLLLFAALRLVSTRQHADPRRRRHHLFHGRIVQHRHLRADAARAAPDGADARIAAGDLRQHRGCRDHHRFAGPRDIGQRDRRVADRLDGNAKRWGGRSRTSSGSSTRTRASRSRARSRRCWRKASSSDSPTTPPSSARTAPSGPSMTAPPRSATPREASSASCWSFATFRNNADRRMSCVRAKRARPRSWKRPSTASSPSTTRAKSSSSILAANRPSATAGLKRSGGRWAN